MEIKKNSVDSAKEKKKELSTILLIFIGTYASVHVHKLSVAYVCIAQCLMQVQASVCCRGHKLEYHKKMF